MHSRIWDFAVRTCLFSVFALQLTAADQTASTAVFRQYCFQCHGGGATVMGGMNLADLTAKSSAGESFQQWQRVAAALESGKMPPKGLPSPTDDQRKQTVQWIRDSLAAYIAKNAGDPGRVTVRRLTSAEYAYAVHDLTGIDQDFGASFANDSVGGEGFTNFGDVQFMQDANLERYLEAAKKVADHAVIGAGPLEFFEEAGRSGFEMSAIHRIKEIYTNYGFRTVSGEGGFSFGTEKYGKVLYTAWRYQHRAALGEPNVSLKDLAAREGLTARFAEHIWSTLHNPNLSYPSTEMVDRWRQFPAPTADRQASETAARKAAEDLQKFLIGWPGWLFARGDAAYGGQGDESPLIINDKSLAVTPVRHFAFNTFGRGGRGRGAPVPGPTKVFINVASVNPKAKTPPIIIWHNPTIAYRTAPLRPVVAMDGQPEFVQPGAAAAGAGAGANPAPAGGRGRGGTGPKLPLRTVVTADSAKALHFGESPDGSTIDPNDFVAGSNASFQFEIPQGMFGAVFEVDATIGKDRDQVFRITFSDRPDAPARGIPVRGLIGDPESAGYKTFKAGVLELKAIWPPNANYSEATPADKDPIPEPFDSTYNVPEHDQFDTDVKYIRDDAFIYNHVLDDAARARVDNAWNDLYTSFPYHDNYVRLIAQHYKLDLHGKHINELTKADIDTMPAEPRNYIRGLKAGYDAGLAAQAKAKPHHIEDCLEFAARAWRRPLTEKEKLSLRTFFDKTLSADPDHNAAIRAVIARILISPAFLYRVENSAALAIKPLNSWEMASRLSFFLWSSIPDDELRRAAIAGELNDPNHIQKQVARMTADAKARRLSTEFFGQWLGFYHFDEFKGVDTGRFPEFTPAVREAMYDEAVSYFEYIIRNGRPVREVLASDYDFLNPTLAKFYGVKHDFKSLDKTEMVAGANAFGRGGMLRMGAILTAFSAPLRTSPVKRGDWVLRRILGTPVPPPPADAGSIPADDKLFGGLTLREKLEQHKRNATCANCHVKIDPLGFPLEHYDSTGRWRDKYADGKDIWDKGTLADKTEISGIDGLIEYLKSRDDQVRRTLSTKLAGYALGRTVLASDQPLIDKMVADGGNATFAQLVTEIVTSRQFRNHAVSDAAPATQTKVGEE